VNSAAAAAAFASWKFEPGIIAALLLTAILYTRGWFRLQRSTAHRFPPWRLGSFLAGLGTLFLALTSPLDAFANFLLSIHMVQHLLLTMVAPPLLLLGSPYLPILLGLPRRFRVDAIGPFLNWPALKTAGHFITHPVVTLFLFAISNIAWHVPAFYELALRSPTWHRVEHACFLGTAILFWWNVILPWPIHTTRPRWIAIPYLLLADFQNTALAAFFSFYDRVLYPTYSAAPRVSGLTAQADQAGAGAIMWVPGSIAFLVPCGMIAVQFLSRKRAPLPTASTSRFALKKPPRLRIPFSITNLRRPLQFTLFALAALVIWDGFRGPQLSAMNAAGVLPWTHWRGFTVLALLFVGNLFCMSCPFVLVRDGFRRVFGSARLPWPRFLHNKWLPVVLIAVYLWAYESFGLWDRPWATAMILVGYFTAIVIVDSIFKGSNFCKFVCPIGQFHFVQSLASPAEVRIREPDVCNSCRTYDCIKGNATHRGCELQLFQPRKSGNMDCTFCLDCVSACPHENVAIQPAAPGHDLWEPETRSSIGRWESRLDLAALVLVLTFGAFANAAGMIVPIQAMEAASGFSHIGFTTIFLLMLVLVVPAIGTTIAAVLSRRHERIRATLGRTLAAYAIALAPVGFGMWLAHFAFHLFTASHTPIPVFQRLLGIAPDWAIASWAWPGLLGLELVLLDAGFLLTLYAIWRIARYRALRPVRAALPWAAIATALYVFGVWIIFQPMQMRGTLSP
jgi:cytochrome c oxidase assembly factor CtaG